MSPLSAEQTAQKLYRLFLLLNLDLIDDETETEGGKWLSFSHYCPSGEKVEEWISRLSLLLLPNTHYIKFPALWSNIINNNLNNCMYYQINQEK